MQQRDSSGAVGVVLDLCDTSVDAIFVTALEVNDAVLTFVATTDVTRRDASGVVATTGLWQWAQKRLLRRRAGDLDEVGDG